MLKYRNHKPKLSDLFAVEVMKFAHKLDAVKYRKEVDFGFLYSSTLTEDFNYPKNVNFEKIEVGGITVECISNADEQIKYALIQLHGGAYVLEYNNSYRRCAHQYMKANESMKVFSPIYSLAPEKPYPHALNEVVELYKYLLENGFSNDRIIIAGDSAGGGLALAVTLYFRDNEIPLPKALITMSAWTNLEMDGISHEKNKFVDPMFGKGTMPLDIHAYAQDNDLKNPYISPKYGDYSRFTDVLMFVGGNELIESDTLDVAELAKKTNEVIVHNFLEMFHVFPLGFKKMASSRKAWHIIKDYINKKFEVEDGRK